MSKRKPFNNSIGYVASRHNLINGGWVVIYVAKEQGLDDSDGKYAISCELHHVLTNAPSVLKARRFLKYPEFCESCMSDMKNSRKD